MNSTPAKPNMLGGTIFTKYVGTVDIHSGSQARLTLDDKNARGFCIGFQPTLPDADAVDVQIIDTGSQSKRALVIASYCDGTISAEVWQM